MCWRIFSITTLICISQLIDQILKTLVLTLVPVCEQVSISNCVPTAYCLQSSLRGIIINIKTNVKLFRIMSKLQLKQTCSWCELKYLFVELLYFPFNFIFLVIQILFFNIIFPFLRHSLSLYQCQIISLYCGFKMLQVNLFRIRKISRQFSQLQSSEKQQRLLRFPLVFTRRNPRANKAGNATSCNKVNSM